MSRLNEFDEWYNVTFGNVLGAEDEDNREAVRKIWNGAIEYVAKKFDFDDDMHFRGDEVAEKMRRMKANGSNHP